MNAREFEDPSFICCCPEACTHTNSAHIDAACGKAEQLVRREHTLENDAIERKTLTDEHERNKKKQPQNAPEKRNVVVKSGGQFIVFPHVFI